MRKFAYVKIFGRRKNALVFLTLLLWCTLMWCCSSWLSMLPKHTLRPSEETNLQHLRRNRNLANYMNNIHLLVEPVSPPCPKNVKVPVIILVASSPQRMEQRLAVRRTWGKLQPTYFLLGLSKTDIGKQLDENKQEAKQYNDLVVFDFTDHFQNLTLKTALMIYWTIGRCPQAQFMLKTDDDVLVKPWTLKNIMKEKPYAKLIGHKVTDTLVLRAPFIKWYVPHWLYSMDIVPQQLSGAGYLINGKYLQRILQKAYEVPIVNLEDMYFTYLVAHMNLGFDLHHDWRINPKKPWINSECAYYSWALTHGYKPEEMTTAWEKVVALALEDSRVCGFLSKILENDFFMTYHN